MKPLRLFNAKYFDLEFFKLLGEGLTQEAAFEKLNEAYKEATGQSRYSNLQSYRVTKARRLKNK